jgi:hypothetical protein
MSRSSLQNTLSLADPALSYNFDLLLPTIPGSSDTRDLTFKCMTTNIPAPSAEPVEVALHGVVLKYAGRKIYTHEIEVTFLETADYSTRQKFINWNEAMRSWINNTGLLAAGYKTNAQLIVYNDLPQVVRTVNVFGLWPATIGEQALDGAASNVVTMAITFNFDYLVDAT